MVTCDSNMLTSHGIVTFHGQGTDTCIYLSTREFTCSLHCTMAALTLPGNAFLVQACSKLVPIRPRRAAAYHKPARHVWTMRRSQAALSIVCSSSSSEEAASLAGMCSILLVTAGMCPHAESAAAAADTGRAAKEGDVVSVHYSVLDGNQV